MITVKKDTGMTEEEKKVGETRTEMMDYVFDLDLKTEEKSKIMLMALKYATAMSIHVITK